MHFQKQFVDVSGQHGLMIMIGWNIVFQRMHPIVSIAFLFRREAEHEKFGHVVFSKTGYDNWKNAENRGFPEHCRLLMAATTRQENVPMTLVIKGQVSHVSLSLIL